MRPPKCTVWSKVGEGDCVPGDRLRCSRGRVTLKGKWTENQTRDWKQLFHQFPSVFVPFPMSAYGFLHLDESLYPLFQWLPPAPSGSHHLSALPCLVFRLPSCAQSHSVQTKTEIQDCSCSLCPPCLPASKAEEFTLSFLPLFLGLPV